MSRSAGRRGRAARLSTLALSLVASAAWADPGLPGHCAARLVAPAWRAAALPDGSGDVGSARDAERRGDLAAAAERWLETARTESDPLERAEALGRAGELRAALGFEDEGRALMQQALDGLAAARPVRAAALRAALARQLLGSGELERARSELALALAEAGSSPREQAGIQLVLADLEQRAGQTDASLAACESARELAEQSGDDLRAAQALATALRLRSEPAPGSNTPEQADAALERALALPDGDARARLLVHLGSSLERDARPDFQLRADRAYRAAAGSAGASPATRAFALGDRAALYERSGRRDEALLLTRRALFAAEAGGVAEARYRLDAQLARLLESRGERAQALDAYRRSLRTLAGLRDSGAGQSLAFDRAVEPVYLALVDLLLREAEGRDEPERRRLLLEARDRIEDMKSVELTDHFRDACLVEENKRPLEQSGDALVVYPILLPDRTALVLSRGDRISALTADVPKQRLEQEVNAFRRTLQKRSRRDYLVHAAQLYDWLIRPFESQLAPDTPEALVFVPSGVLRTIPMSSLYDREARAYLIEKLPIAVVPALTLTDPTAIEREGVRSLLAGITEARQGFPALENVRSEIDAVEAILKAPAPLMNSGFSTRALESALADQDFGIVHIASHGRFDAESAKSFLLTYDGQVGMDQLAALVERRRVSGSPVELLTLSACETAVGDERAALGLAGVAVRAGARSALATLWTVNDQAASELIAEFYRQLAVEHMPRGEALRRAQLSLLASRPYRHPGYWSPFVLISNWM